jgi:hypothetical protein
LNVFELGHVALYREYWSFCDRPTSGNDNFVTQRTEKVHRPRTPFRGRGRNCRPPRQESDGSVLATLRGMAIAPQGSAWPGISDDDVSPRCSYPPDTTLFQEGERPRFVYFIESGAIRLNRRQNARDVLVAVRSPGWVLGSTSVILGVEHGATARTLTVCELSCISRGVFQRSLDSNIIFCRWLLNSIASESYEQMQRGAGMLVSTGRDRIEALLVELFAAGFERLSDGALQLSMGICQFSKPRDPSLRFFSKPIPPRG